jgi:hypothetical protein
MALALVLIPVSNALAATSADVTVTADPLFLSITSLPGIWTINGLGGGTESGQIAVNTTYYANPIPNADDTTPPSSTVLGTECNFTVTNAAGAETCDLTVTWGAFTGGSATMTNKDTDGSNGPTTYGAFCWYEGMLYANKVVVKSSGSAKMYTVGLAAAGTLKWGVEIKTRTNDWTGGTASTSTLTITATMH